MRGKGRYAYQFPVIPGTGTPSDERCPLVVFPRVITPRKPTGYTRNRR